MSLVKDGSFYSRITSNTAFYTPEDRVCIEETVALLSSRETSAASPGMLLGKIQSGKTKTFLAIVALAFDNEFDIAVILTKGTKPLARQTLQRVRRDFAYFAANDALQIHDILSVPPALTGYELRQKLIFVAKKQTDNLERFKALFQTTYPDLADRRVLIIDDEADYASVGFRASRDQATAANVTTQQIDDLRTILRSSAILQVTATPYALYLQPEELSVNGVEFHPVRPAFTKLVPVHPAYIGSDYYFNPDADPDSVASLIFEPLNLRELTILQSQDRRRFRIEECLSHDGIAVLRSAICNFIVGAIVRRLQDEHAEVGPKKFSFVIHTETGRAAHTWQESIINALNQSLTEAARRDSPVLLELLSSAYQNIAESVQRLRVQVPSEEEVIAAAVDALQQGWLMVTKVNTDREAESLLDEDGQLKLRTPLNVFIGGQMLDRGITVSNLIGFYHGRRPNVFQQDTVLQHSRMFGFRPIEDLAVTRFYTAPQIYQAMRRMHESDVALRAELEADALSPVVFIQRDNSGSIVPCSPSKTLVSSTTTLRPFKRILPIGFQTEAPNRMRQGISSIDSILDEPVPNGDFRLPFRISLVNAKEILRLIEQTVKLDIENGYDFDWRVLSATLNYLSGTSSATDDIQEIWCLVRKDRNNSRFIGTAGREAYTDAPDTAHVEGRIAREYCVDRPMLMLFRENGSEAHGWRGAPFYWPVVYAPANTRTAIFAHTTSA